MAVTPRDRPATAERGFTLIEVMVSLVIVSLALAAVSASISQMADAAIAMQQRSYASWIAQNKIVEMRLTPALPEVSETEGDTIYAGQEWLWRANVSETGVENLFRVDVTVTLASSGESFRPVTGFIGEPTPPGMANAAWRGLSLPGESPDDGSDDGARQ